MGKNPKAPAQTPAQIEAERLNNELLRTNLANAKKPAAVPDLRAPEATLLAPAPARNAADVLAAEEAARKKSGKRTNAGRGTLFAGDTGRASTGMKTLLG